MAFAFAERPNNGVSYKRWIYVVGANPTKALFFAMKLVIGSYVVPLEAIAIYLQPANVHICTSGLNVHIRTLLLICFPIKVCLKELQTQ